MPNIELRHENLKAEILFKGEFTDESAINLEKVLNVAFSYYQYNEVDIKINSPGGSVNSLYFLVETFNKFKAEGKVIGMTALFEAFSAGAFLLSCASIKKRKAHHDAKLVYHHTRVHLKNSYITKETAKKLTDILKKEDEISIKTITDAGMDMVCYYRNTLSKSNFNKIISRFIKQAHNMDLIKQKTIKKFDKGRFRKILKEAYSNLFKKDTIITPQIALNLFLIDKII